jgi:hypothetical protein
MPNAWDGLSARMFAQADFAATATSSAALAFSLGRRDGRHEVNRDEQLAYARLLSSASGLPVNGDFEDGYGGRVSGMRVGLTDRIRTRHEGSFVCANDRIEHERTNKSSSSAHAPPWTLPSRVFREHARPPYARWCSLILR